jgi:predicted ATP-grasp superfamily ATP-dependent carboligase
MGGLQPAITPAGTHMETPRKNPAATGQVLIVGASARAAAQSALRAGWLPIAIDPFCDEDLRASCQAVRAPHYPRGLAEIAKTLPSCPFIYTGALENHLEELEALARQRPLLGNSASVVRSVRDPLILQKHLAGCPTAMPDMKSLDEPRPSGEWLLKPYRSGGGIGIQRIKQDTLGQWNDSPYTSKTHYYQRLVPGVAISVLYLADRRRATLVGVTEQLIGCRWAGAKPFWYVGNVGPRIVSPPAMEQLQQVGHMLTCEFGLVGWFGADMILDEDQVWLLEVNPRYTASTEILERILNQPLFPLHVEACQGKNELPPVLPRPLDGTVHGKAIVYTDLPLVVPGSFFPIVSNSTANTPFPMIADVPAADSRIPAGAPICTVFASGKSYAGVVELLRGKAQDLLRAITKASGLTEGEKLRGKK